MMHDENIVPPEKVPEPGFYYHYKHDPNGSEFTYAYELMGVGHHTEDDCRPEDSFIAVYRPLYESALVYKLGKMFDIRPLDMFMESVVKDGKEMPRFARIIDPGLIEKLKAKRDELYS